MIIPDITLLAAAYDATASKHDVARRWWEEVLSSAEPVGIPSRVALGFVQVVTNPRVFDVPMSAAEASGHVRAWLGQPNVSLLDTDGALLERTLALLEQAGVAGPLTVCAQLAALALEHDAVLCTTDPEFLRFPGLRWRNPITGVAARNKRSA